MAKKPAARPEHIEDDDMVDVRIGGQDITTHGAEDDEDEDDEDTLRGASFDDDDDDSSNTGDDDDDSTGDDDDDSTGDDDDAQQSTTKVPNVPRKKKQSAKERIEELAEKRRAAEREAFDAEMRAQAAERRLAELEAGGTQTTTKELPPKPDPKDFVYGDVDPKYQDAMVEYRVAEETAKFQKQASESQDAAALEAQRAHYDAKVAEVMEQGSKSERHPKFKETVEAATFDGHLARLIVDSSSAVDIAYHLANNLGELLKVTRMSPEERAREIGRLEGRFSAGSAARKRTSAPETRQANRKTRKAEDSGQYGPEAQDDFDKEFFRR